MSWSLRLAHGFAPTVLLQTKPSSFANKNTAPALPWDEPMLIDCMEELNMKLEEEWKKNPSADRVGFGLTNPAIRAMSMVPIEFVVDFTKMMVFTDSFIAQVLLSLLFDAKEWEVCSSTFNSSQPNPSHANIEFSCMIDRCRLSTSVYTGFGGICDDEIRPFHVSADMWDALQTVNSLPFYWRFRTDLYEIRITNNGYLMQTNLHTMNGRILYTPMRKQELRIIKPPPPFAMKKLVLNVPEDADVPARLLCPIKYSIFKDPVIFPADGRTYEREAIEEWISKSTGLPFGGSFDSTNPVLTNLIPNMYVRDAVIEFIEDYETKQTMPTKRPRLDTRT